MASGIPVIAIDGPSGVGKGTISHMLAESLNWHYLDSGALYRVTGCACAIEGVHLDDEAGVTDVARNLEVRFQLDHNGEVLVFYQGLDVSRKIRTEEGGRGASRVGAIAGVRDALLQRQREFCRAPGLVADGRDMGTVVFPRAALKMFLTASSQVRAKRRYKQLITKGESVNLPRLLEDIKERDLRDSSRDISPLVPAEDAVIIDTSELSIEQVFAEVSRLVEEKGLR